MCAGSSWVSRTNARWPQRQVWRVTWQVQEATEAITAQAQRECRFVLATNVLDAQELTDVELLRTYKGSRLPS